MPTRNATIRHFVTNAPADYGLTVEVQIDGRPLPVWAALDDVHATLHPGDRVLAYQAREGWIWRVSVPREV